MLLLCFYMQHLVILSVTAKFNSETQAFLPSSFTWFVRMCKFTFFELLSSVLCVIVYSVCVCVLFVVCYLWIFYFWIQVFDYYLWTLSLIITYEHCLWLLPMNTVFDYYLWLLSLNTGVWIQVFEYKYLIIFVYPTYDYLNFFLIN